MRVRVSGQHISGIGTFSRTNGLRSSYIRSARMADLLAPLLHDDLMAQMDIGSEIAALFGDFSTCRDRAANVTWGYREVESMSRLFGTPPVDARFRLP